MPRGMLPNCCAIQMIPLNRLIGVYPTTTSWNIVETGSFDRELCRLQRCNHIGKEGAGNSYD